MNFTLPEARRERMEQLIEYLGDRAEDFNKCFDIESEWCWKYADLMLRGIESRDLEYSEGHHIVPASFYGKRSCKMVDECNLTVLTYGEHLWAHYCMVFCTTGKMRGKMAKAFLMMYYIGNNGRRPLMPSEAELLVAIPKMEFRRIRAMEPRWAKVEAEGRTHKYDDPVQYRKDFYEANKEKFAELAKAYYETNGDKIREQKKAYREANKEKIIERRKSYYEANKEKIIERRKSYYEVNSDKIREHAKSYYEANKEKITKYKKAWQETNSDKIREHKKAYHEANKEKIAKQQKAHYEANKEKILEYHKAHYEANKEKILEQRKVYRETNKEKVAKQQKTYYEVNKGELLEYHKEYYDAKKAAGYRKRKNPITGKRGWVFVGLPEQEVAA